MPKTGSTRHYLKADVPHLPLTNMGPPIHVGCPNGQTIKSSKPRLLDFPDLSDEVYGGHILPRLTHSSHVSIGKICDVGFTAMFKSQEV